jgi:hypothetical protein
LKIAGIPANEGPTTSDPKTPVARVFDQNDHVWQAPGGTNPGVLVASLAEIAAIQTKYPNIPADSAPFLLTMWEDDDIRGKIVQSSDWDNAMIHTLLAVALGALIVPDIADGDSSSSTLTKIGLFPFLGEIYRSLGNFRRLLQGSNDDYLGLILATDQVGSLGLTSSQPYTLVRKLQKNGDIKLILRH